MQKVKIIRLKNLSPTARRLLFEGQKEVARVWNFCVEVHKKARTTRETWPTKDHLQKATKGGKYALHSQSIQMVIAQFLANVDTTKQIKKENKKIRFPYKPEFWVDFTYSQGLFSFFSIFLPRKGHFGPSLR